MCFRDVSKSALRVPQVIFQLSAFRFQLFSDDRASVSHACLMLLDVFLLQAEFFGGV